MCWGQVTTPWSQSFPSTFPWVLGIELGPPRLLSKHLHPLGHLASPLLGLVLLGRKEMFLRSSTSQPCRVEKTESICLSVSKRWDMSLSCLDSQMYYKWKWKWDIPLPELELRVQWFCISFFSLCVALDSLVLPMCWAHTPVSATSHWVLGFTGRSYCFYSFQKILFKTGSCVLQVGLCCS